MKALIRTILFAFLLIPTLLLAQLPNGSIAPNFTGTDLNGVTYTLYDLLDQGKTVVMDVSATWCGPCWGYHQSNALEDTWAQYGPNGTNQIVVLFIEGDPSTNLACLQGDDANCSSSTQGDWITNTPYPIIDDASIGDLYEIGYFPTIYAICPNRRLIEINQVGPAAFAAFANNCPMAAGANNGGLLGMTTGVNSDYYCGATTLHPKAEFQNLGSQAITSAKFQLVINGATIQEKTWTGNLETYEIGNVEFDAYNLNSDEIIDLGTTISAINGVQDEFVANDYASTLLVPNQNIIEENRVRFELRCDAQPEQTRWEFRGINGEVLYSGGNPAAQPGAQTPNLMGGYNPNQFIKDTFSLPAPGCYEFYIVDDRGNGLNVGAYYKLMTMDGNVIAENSPFEAAHTDWIKAENIPTSNTSISIYQRVNIYPNPTEMEATIAWENLTFEPYRVTVTDIMGKTIEEIQISGRNGTQKVLRNQLADGLYFVNIFGGTKSVSQKLIVTNK
jgi:Secretion system C-terminal sorting domain/AhpC/TSA family